MISLLTFNIWQLPFFGSARRVSLAAELIDEIAPDVVVLNEAFNRHSRSLISRAGYSATPAFGDRRLAVNSGIRVLSRLPAAASFSHTYKAYRPLTTDAFANKGVRLISLDGVWIAATHLQADERGRCHGVRLAQLAELRTFVTSHVPPDQPVIIAGDLNAETADRAAVETVIGGRLSDTHAATYDGHNPLLGRRYTAYAEVLDYVGFLDETGRRPHPEISTETIVYQRGHEASDHYPVLARISL